MKKLLFLFLLVGMFQSCASNKGYQAFYNDHKQDADLALSLPKWILLPFVDKDDKEMVKTLAKGMKKIRLIYDEDNDIAQKFKDYKTFDQYAKYLYTKDGSDEIELYALQDGDRIKEMVLTIDTNEESVIVAIIGNMSMDNFNKDIGPYLR